MDLKSRYRIFYFMYNLFICKKKRLAKASIPHQAYPKLKLRIFEIITATSPLHSCIGYYDGLKMRAQKIQEYGEKLSSIENDAVPLEFGREEPFEKSDELRGNKKKVTGEVTENDQEGTTIAFSTKCTTDKNIKVKDEYKPDTSKGEDEDKPDTSKENPSEEGEEGKEESVGDEKQLKKEDSSEEAVKVTKVYHPPKPAKLLDHYIDDV